jgi:glycosyltransferase involved in cell wall biosynthesis
VSGTVHVVLPAGVADPAAPSGGNAYDRRVCAELPRHGWTVAELPVHGGWPRPDAAARAGLDAALAAVDDGAAVLLDGLVACGVPEVVVPHARRLALAVLVHLPLGDEAGAADLAGPEGEVLRAAAVVVATSPWTARRIVAVHGVPGERVHVGAPGVDAAPAARGTDGAGRLLCVGSLTPTKGQDVLVDALAAVAELPWTCDLVGPPVRDPAFAERVRAAAALRGLDDRVRLTGPLTGVALADAYDAADLLVVPSRTEAYGMVVTEALARGVPVLATTAGGLLDTLGGPPVPGLLVPPGDPAALAAALRRWLADPALRGTLRNAAGRRRRTLDGWEVTARCLATALDALPRRIGARG